MSAQIIDGRKLAEQIKDELVQEIIKLPEHPNLAIILVGQQSDSCLYVSLKEKEGKKCGVDVHCYKFDEDTIEDELLKCIEFLNNDNKINGILIQLPLPGKFNTNKIIAGVKPEKDIDGFHPRNLQKIASGKNYIMPPLAGAVLEICKDIKCDLQNKKVVIIGKSDILSQGLGDILKQRNCDITTVKPSDSDLQNKSKQADVLVTAVGKKHYLTADYIKPGAVVIDIGIIKEEKKVYGDVDFESVSNAASYVTPVPGGVGPMTIACAFRNVLKFYKMARE